MAAFVALDRVSHAYGGEGGTHSAADHSQAGHSESHTGTGPGHAHTPSNLRLRGGILFASRAQDIDKLFVFVTIIFFRS